MPLFAFASSALLLPRLLLQTPSVTTPVVAPAPTSASAPVSVATSPRPRRIALAGFAEGALGFADDGFYNQLVGLRLDFRPAKRLAIGFALSYANLKGKNGRAHNALPAAMLEWSFPASKSISVPLRFYSGYLPNNGPWLKAALGLSHPLSEHSRFTIEAIAPALWIVHDASVGSFDALLEYAVDL